MPLNVKLVKLRKKKGLSQLELAEQMNVSRQAISRWETGMSVPSSENLKYLSDMYGVTIDYLLNEKEEPVQEVSIGSGENQVDRQERKTPIRNIAKLIGIVGGSFILLLMVYVVVGKGNDSVPINEANREEVQVDTATKFDFEW